MSEADRFVTLGPFGMGVCPPRMDVTLGRADDPNADDYNGILDYKAMTLGEAMRLYWFMKDMDVTGTSSVSASSTFSGSYDRVIRKVVKPLTNPREYVLETVEEWSTSADSGELSETSTMAISSTDDEGGRNHTPVEPEERVCNPRRVIKDYRMEGIESDGSDTQPDDGSRSITASAGCEMGSMYFYSHGSYGYSTPYGGYSSYTPQGDASTVFLRIPPNLYSFFDNDVFVGYGFSSFASAECVISCSAAVSVPSPVPSYHEDTQVGVFMGGFFDISSIVYTAEFGQWFGTGKYQTVNLAGVDMIASSSGTDNVNISESEGGVKFSYSDSDTGTPTFDFDNKNEDGAGVTFSGEGQIDCAGSFEILFHEPTFYPYPSW